MAETQLLAVTSTATAQLVALGKRVDVWGFIKGASATASVITLRDGGSGGTVKLTLPSSTAEGVAMFPGPIQFQNGLHVTHSAAGGDVELLVTAK